MNETCEQSNAVPDDGALKQQLKSIDQTLIVLSGKGGVGKSTVAVNVALSLALQGFRTGLLDIDIHGPSVPKLLNISSRRLGALDGKIVPMESYLGLKVMSMGFLLDQDDQPVIWRGPLKYNVIKEFLQNVAWGELDYLVVDCPPGTGDEPLSIAQMLKEKASAIIVTTPQQVATVDVAKCITFCNQLDLPIAGIIENMSGFVCPHCGKEVDVFSHGGGEKLASHYNVPFLGKIPLDPEIVKSGDEGQPYVYFYAKTKTAERFAEMVETMVRQKSLLKEEIS